MASRRWSEQDRDKVIRLVAQGKSRGQIAKALKTSESSLRRHFADVLNHVPGGRPHEFTDAEKASAIAMSSYGIPQREIADALGVALITLRKHLGEDLKRAPTQANANVARALYRSATRDNSTQAQVFWLKARAGWKDRLDVGGSFGVTHTGEVEHRHSLDLVGLVRDLSPDGRAALRVVLEEVRYLRAGDAPEPIDVEPVAAGAGAPQRLRPLPG